MHIPQHTIAAAAILFEKANGNPLSQFEIDEVERHGLAEIDPELVAKALEKSVRDDNNLDSTYRQLAYWALGKRFDTSLLPFFRDQLRLELRRDLVAVYQILIALDNLAEPVFSEARDGTVAMDEYLLNQNDAELYLNRLPNQNHDMDR